MKFKIQIVILLLIITENSYSQKNVAELEKPKFWHHEDYSISSILGIGLEKTINSLKGNTSLKQIVVAVIDTQIDTYHEDLKNSLWINKKEIPNNRIDDDNNGYIDDVNGWNFLGTKSGNYIVWANFDYIRIIREYDPIFKNKVPEEVASTDKTKYKQYLRAIEYQDKWSQYYSNYLKSMKYNISSFHKVKDTLKYFFPKEDYTYSQLDSLYRKYKINDKPFNKRRDSNDQDLGALLDSYLVNLDINIKNYEELTDRMKYYDSIVNKSCNLLYNERKLIGDNQNTLQNGYGNNKIQIEIKGIPIFSNHSTEVSTVIAANRKNNLGIKGFSDNIKIMPLTICSSGDEYDADIANAIYYAVDNGAKVINMSFGKEFYMYTEWVSEAFQYAEKNNVLLVHAAGNNGFNIDENQMYPNDYLYDEKTEVSNNFINVGSINKNYGEKMVSSFSNYGKNNVDLFAPGEEIYTAIPDNKYSFDSGTSLAAPMVSGTAALIWLYYPKLTVQQVKQIILESGTSYDLEVIVPGSKDKKVKFTELSKTGKVLNVYNAMQMAKKISERNG